MKRSVRITALIASLILLVTLFTPLWEIKLTAPQYPDPLGLHISVDKIESMNEFDLENINLLNHYIGMKHIVPESIPELGFMKYIIIGFMAFGLVVFLSKSNKLLYTWVILISIAGVALLYDFNAWEKDYGTNLDPMAAIKVEGMTYKPPLIGSKELLNITAYSYPHIGGVAFFLSILIGWIAFFMTRYNIRHEIQAKLPIVRKKEALLKTT